MMTAIPDPHVLILLQKHNALRLLKDAYQKVLIPTSIIEEIPTNALDEALTEGWMEFFDPEMNYLMQVDKIESKSGIRLSVHEEACLALALQHKAQPVLTNDREVDTVAGILEITTAGIPSVIIGASRSGTIPKREGLELFHNIYGRMLPGLGIERLFENCPKWQESDTKTQQHPL